MTNLAQIIEQYKNDSESVYNTWFIDNDQRLKAFRTIRRGVLQVIEDIKNQTFPNDFKGSSLEFVLSCIAEQKQPNCAYLTSMKIKTINQLLVSSLKTASMQNLKNRF
jgi:hypothetical protein